MVFRVKSNFDDNQHIASRRIAVIARQLRSSGAAAPQIGPKIFETSGTDVKLVGSFGKMRTPLTTLEYAIRIEPLFNFITCMNTRHLVFPCSRLRSAFCDLLPTKIHLICFQAVKGNFCPLAVHQRKFPLLFRVNISQRPWQTPPWKLVRRLFSAHACGCQLTHLAQCLCLFARVARI